MENKPVVGMGATRIMWSDRHAYTIVAVSNNNKRITVQRDRVAPVPGEMNLYTYASDANGQTFKLSHRKDGSWRVIAGANVSKHYHNQLFTIGERYEYYDYSF